MLRLDESENFWRRETFIESSVVLVKNIYQNLGETYLYYFVVWKFRRILSRYGSLTNLGDIFEVLPGIFDFREEGIKDESDQISRKDTKKQFVKYS